MYGVRKTAGQRSLSLARDGKVRTRFLRIEESMVFIIFERGGRDGSRVLASYHIGNMADQPFGI